MKTALIVCHGYFGDHLFANSIAEHLIKEDQFDEVDYVIGFPQVFPFFVRNPYVRNVFIDRVGPSPSIPSNVDTYNKVFQLGPVARILPPAVEMQLACGVKNPSPRFHINTDSEMDKLVLDYYGEKIGLTLGLMNGWKERSFLFTREQYERGIDVPNLGYGGAHRNTDWIMEQLELEFNTIRVGTVGKVNQFTVHHEGPSLDLTASILKYCDIFIGAEGGLANLAYAVGTDTILTSDFVHQLYGPNGVLQKLPEPKLGPVYYEGSGMHINLDPFLSDEEVFLEVAKILDNNRSKYEL